MNADSAYVIGSAHFTCQDYGVARVRPSDKSPDANGGQFAYAILSDGCSSSPDTDFGSRLLVRATAALFDSDQSILTTPADRVHQLAAAEALKHAGHIGLQPSSVDATLFSIIATEDEVTVGCSGDGVVVCESGSGDWDVFSIASPAGYPLYPAYFQQADRLNALSTEQRLRRISHYRKARSEEVLRLESAREVSSATETIRRRVTSTRLAMVFTDGLHSFCRLDSTSTSRTLTGVGFEQVLIDFSRFKNFNGLFLQRRLKRFLADGRRINRINTDDFGCAAIYLGEGYDPQLDSNGQEGVD